jgi:hypothetical protein
MEVPEFPILLKNEFYVQTSRLGTFYSKLARLVDFRGLRTKACRTFSIFDTRSTLAWLHLRYTDSFNEPIVPR